LHFARIKKKSGTSMMDKHGLFSEWAL
jgi:hypothetical protein